MFGMLALLDEPCKNVARHVHHAAHKIILQPPSLPPVINNNIFEPAGTPEWVKILISGLLGAILGLVSSMLIEHWKASRAKKAITKEAREGVIAELRGNLDLINSHWRYLSSSDESTAHDDENEIAARTWVILQEISRDRFNHYFSDHKSILYAIDPNKELVSFYKDIDKIQFFANMRKPEGVMAGTSTARSRGITFLKENGIEYEPQGTLVDKIDELKAKGIWPRS